MPDWVGWVSSVSFTIGILFFVWPVGDSKAGSEPEPELDLDEETREWLYRQTNLVAIAEGKMPLTRFEQLDHDPLPEEPVPPPPPGGGASSLRNTKARMDERIAQLHRDLRDNRKAAREHDALIRDYRAYLETPVWDDDLGMIVPPKPPACQCDCSGPTTTLETMGGTVLVQHEHAWLEPGDRPGPRWMPQGVRKFQPGKYF